MLPQYRCAKGVTVTPRQPIPRLSKRGAERNKEYARAKRQWWKLVQSCKCPVMLLLFAKVVPVSKSPHHTRGRIGTLLCDTRYWLAVSERGHEWIHQHPKEAREHGWLCPVGFWGKQS